MYRFILVLLACGLTACGGDSTAPQQAGVAGSWIYRVNQLSDGGSVTCTMIDADTLSLDRSTENIAGTFAGGDIRCRNADDVETIAMVTGAVVNGTVEPVASGAQNVTFDLGGAYWHQAGRLTGNRMSGTLTIDHGFTGRLGNMHLTGSWSAIRSSLITHRQPK